VGTADHDARHPPIQQRRRISRWVTALTLIGAALIGLYHWIVPSPLRQHPALAAWQPEEAHWEATWTELANGFPIQGDHEILSLPILLPSTGSSTSLMRGMPQGPQTAARNPRLQGITWPELHQLLVEDAIVLILDRGFHPADLLIIDPSTLAIRAQTQVPPVAIPNQGPAHGRTLPVARFKDGSLAVLQMGFASEWYGPWCRRFDPTTGLWDDPKLVKTLNWVEQVCAASPVGGQTLDLVVWRSSLQEWRTSLWIEEVRIDWSTGEAIHGRTRGPGEERLPEPDRTGFPDTFRSEATFPIAEPPIGIETLHSHRVLEVLPRAADELQWEARERLWGPDRHKRFTAYDNERITLRGRDRSAGTFTEVPRSIVDPVEWSSPWLHDHGLELYGHDGERALLSQVVFPGPPGIEGGVLRLGLLDRSMGIDWLGFLALPSGFVDYRFTPTVVIFAPNGGGSSPCNPPTFRSLARPSFGFGGPWSPIPKGAPLPSAGNCSGFSRPQPHGQVRVIRWDWGLYARGRTGSRQP